VSSERHPTAIEAYTAVDHGRDPAALLASMDALEQRSTGGQVDAAPVRR
jgi:hypothetical protein